MYQKVFYGEDKQACKKNIYQKINKDTRENTENSPIITYFRSQCLESVNPVSLPLFEKFIKVAKP